MLLAPGLVPGIPAYSVKVHAKFPGSNPAIQGVLILHDLATGRPLAIMESSYLTALRTDSLVRLGVMPWLILGLIASRLLAQGCKADHNSRRFAW